MPVFTPQVKHSLVEEFAFISFNSWFGTSRVFLNCRIQVEFRHFFGLRSSFGSRSSGYRNSTEDQFPVASSFSASVTAASRMRPTVGSTVFKASTRALIAVMVSLHPN
jgi:hypothetical protein